MLFQKLKVVAFVLVAAAGLLSAGTGLISYRAAAGVPVAIAEQSPPLKEPEEAPNEPQRTANFEVIAPTRALARRVSQAAEERRKALALLWLGREMPAWEKRCVIRVRVTDQGDGSSTTMAFDQGKLLSLHMSLEGTAERIQTDLLAHEITHTVLAHHLGAPVFRWADEGAAQLSESAASGAKTERMLRKIIAEGRLLPLRQLLGLRQYPKDVAVLYAQGYSLTEFLVRKGGRAKFLKLLARADRDGWDKAIKAEVGYDTVADLEKAWRADIGEGRTGERPTKAAKASGRSGWSDPPAVASPRGQLPTSTAPVQALVALEKDGRLSVWRSEIGYRFTPASTDRGGVSVPSHSTPEMIARGGSYALDEVKVHDAAGKKIDRKELTARLQGETLALVSADGQPVDPLHLRLVKEGTLIFVLPAPRQPPPTERPIREAPAGTPLHSHSPAKP